MDIANVVAESINAMEQSGKIREKIDAALNKAVTDIVDDLFGYRSNIREALKGRIVEAMQFDPSRVELPEYQAIIGQQARAALDRYMEAAGLLKTEEVIAGIMGKLESGPIKFSKLVELLKGSEWIDDDDDGHDVSVHVGELECSLRWVYMDFRQGVGKYSCRFRLLLGKDGRISSLKVDESDRKIRSSALELGSASEIETVLIHAYVQQRPIEFDCDVDDLDLEVVGDEVKARRGE